MHWSEFVGGDVVISPPYARQIRLNVSDIEVRPRIDAPVERKIGEEFLKIFVAFRRAYTEEQPLNKNLFHLEQAAALCASPSLHVMIFTIYSGLYASKS